MQRDSFLRLMGLSSIGLSISGLSSLIDFSTSLEKTDKMPTLFIGHGSPMNAIEKIHLLIESNNFNLNFRFLKQLFAYLLIG